MCFESLSVIVSLLRQFLTECTNVELCESEFLRQYLIEALHKYWIRTVQMLPISKAKPFRNANGSIDSSSTSSFAHTNTKVTYCNNEIFSESLHYPKKCILRSSPDIFLMDKYVEKYQHRINGVPS